MNQLFGFQQFLFIAIFMAFAVGSWVFGEIRRQAARKRAKAEARRRYEEQLRTGRPPEEPARGPVRASSQPQSPAQRLAAQRQAQLQQLRQRQSSTSPGSSGSGQPAPSSPVSAPLVRSSRTPMARPTGRPPAGVVIQRVPPSAPAPISRSQPPSVRRPGSAPQRPTRPARPARRVQSPQTPAGGREQRTPPSESRQRPRRSSQRIAPGIPEVPTRQAQAHSARNNDVRALLLGPTGSRADRARALRTLIVATEVLGPPVSMREGQGISSAQI